MVSHQQPTIAQATATPESLTSQIATAQTDLNAALARRSEILAQIDAAEGRGERVRIRNGPLSGASDQVDRLTVQLTDLQAALRLREAIAAIPTAAPSEPTPASLRAQINATEVSLNDALARRAAILAQIDAAQGPAERSQLRNSALPGVGGQIGRFQRRLARLQVELQRREAAPQIPPAQPAQPQPATLPNAVEVVLRRLPTKVLALAVVSLRSSSNSVSAVYARAASGPPEQVRISVTSFDSEGGAEEGRRRGAMTALGPTRNEIVDGERRSWWGDWQVVARVGRHVISISASTRDHTHGSPVQGVFAALVPDLEKIVPTRPARPWALYGPDVIEIFPPGTIAITVDTDYLHGATIQGAAFDLNGDGVDDYLMRGRPFLRAPGTSLRGALLSAHIGRSMAGGCTFLICDGSAGKPIGTLVGNPIVVCEESERGWPVIEGYTHVGGPDGMVTSYAFDGASYAVRSLDPLVGSTGRDRLAALEKVPRWQPGR